MIVMLRDLDVEMDAGQQLFQLKRGDGDFVEDPNSGRCSGGVCVPTCNIGWKRWPPKWRRYRQAAAMPV